MTNLFIFIKSCQRYLLDSNYIKKYSIYAYFRSIFLLSGDICGPNFEVNWDSGRSEIQEEKEQICDVMKKIKLQRLNEKKK